MKFLLLLPALLLGLRQPARAAGPTVRVQLQVAPTTHAFTCRYEFTLPAGDTTTVLRLNLNKRFRVQALPGSQGTTRITPVYYPYFGDTLQQVQVRDDAPSWRARRVVLTYAGELPAGRTTAQALEFSGHSNWLPFRPGREYELLGYTLAVRVPPAYQVRSTQPPTRARPGYFEFRDRTSAVELTAIVALQFGQAVAASGAAVAVAKPGAASLSAQETAILLKAQDIIGFYNRTIGRQDSIARFTIFLTGTKQDAFALLDNATIITYPDFDVTQRGDALILAHEISHRWWGYGEVHTADDWLNEAFATYSSLLYLQTRGDTAGYRQVYARLAATTPGTPALLGFNRDQYEPGMYRRVIYNRGTVVLAALHAQVGTAQFYAILAATAARRASTTTAFLDVVEQVAGPDTRAWLLAELSRAG